MGTLSCCTEFSTFFFGLIKRRWSLHHHRVVAGATATAAFASRLANREAFFRGNCWYLFWGICCGGCCHVSRVFIVGHLLWIIFCLNSRNLWISQRVFHSRVASLKVIWSKTCTPFATPDFRKVFGSTHLGICKKKLPDFQWDHFWVVRSRFKKPQPVFFLLCFLFINPGETMNSLEKKISAWGPEIWFDVTFRGEKLDGKEASAVDFWWRKRWWKMVYSCGLDDVGCFGENFENKKTH